MQDVLDDDCNLLVFDVFKHIHNLNDRSKKNHGLHEVFVTPIPIEKKLAVSFIYHNDVHQQ